MGARGTASWIAAVWVLALGGCAYQDDGQAFETFSQWNQASSAGLAESGRSAASRPSEPVRLTDRSSLPDYLAYAALNNPGLEAAFYRWKAALERIPQARALSDPQFTFRYYVIEQGMRDGDMRFMYEIAQMIPWFGKLELRGDIAVQEAQSQFQRFRMEKLKLLNRVKQAHYEYYYLTRAVAVTQASLQQLQLIEDAARFRYAAGTGSQGDLIRAQVEMGKLQNDLHSMQDMRSPTLAKLNAALNRPAEAELPTPGPILEEKVTVGDAQLVAWLKESSPDLKAMDFDIAREKRSIELARKDYYPDLMIGYEYDQMFSAPGDMTGSMKNPAALMLSVNLPVWWDKYAAGVREAQARTWAAQKDKAEKSNAMESDLKMAAYSYRNAMRKIVLYRDTLLPRAREALKSLLAGYKTGGAGFSDVIDAQRILLDFELSYERAMADAQQGLSEMEMLVGRTIPREGGATPGAPASQPGKEKSRD
jgi:outer membrane protein TolC